MTNTEAVCEDEVDHIIYIIKELVNIYRNIKESGVYDMYDIGMIDGLKKSVEIVSGYWEVVHVKEPTKEFIYLRDSKDGHKIIGSVFMI